jgi:hypothetical protein
MVSTVKSSTEYRVTTVYFLVSASQMTKISHLTDQGPPLTRDPNVEIFIYVSIRVRVRVGYVVISSQPLNQPPKTKCRYPLVMVNLR